MNHLNDGSGDPPSLKVFLNMDNLQGLPAWSVWGGLEGEQRFARLAADGFEGVQLTNREAPPGGCLPYCGLDRISLPREAIEVATLHRDRGDSCISVHVGWGTEDDAEIDRLVEATLDASSRCALPIFIETHRATITQDMWRTVKIAERFPEVRFNGDFSHYYCGQEMVYGGIENKMAFLRPVFDRIGFMHGRISSPGCMQVPVEPGFDRKPIQAHGVADYLADFRRLWTEAMKGFLRSARAGDVLIFAPELLAGTYYYARLFPSDRGELVEESDRYAQALIYRDLARACFADALAAVSFS